MSILSFIKRKILRNKKERWNHQYASGKWEGLKNEVELDRLLVVRDWVWSIGNKLNILEIGCGEGIFTPMLQGRFQSYTGVDVSDFAISKAIKTAAPNESYLVADMDNHHWQQNFDVIIFNESIYYSTDLNRLLKVIYSPMFKAGCVFIFSIHSFPKSDKVWEIIENHLGKGEEKTVINNHSKWILKKY
jgi:predicted TPR repeat methyltransferase